MPQRETVADLFATARRNAALSVPELAVRAKVNTATLYRIEAGERTNPQMSTVRAVADALGIEPNQLIPAARTKDAA